MKIKATVKKIFDSISSFLKRRPHRSFKMTRRRDYKRSLKIPGYIKFSKEVFDIIKSNRKSFLILCLVYIVFSFFLIGIMSESNFSILSEGLDVSSVEILSGFWGEIGKSVLLIVSTLTGSTSSLSEAQQLMSIILILFMWLACVWMLRNILAGKKFKVRDALYSSGSPVLATMVVFVLISIQLIPVVIGLFGYGAAIATGLLVAGGVESMMFWVAFGLLILLSIYWITGSIFALIIITLPGMYPYQAIKTSGDLVVGRRLRLMFRLVWMIIVSLLGWILIIPIVLFDGWLKNVTDFVDWLPVVPFFIHVASTLTILWFSAYIYLLYRKVIADESSPA